MLFAHVTHQGVTTDLHECMKLMWTEYITALRQVEPASPQQGRRAWRPTLDEQKRREETRLNAQRACEEMEPHWKLALRQLTRVFTNARGNFDCFEYRLIPDKWDSWLVRTTLIFPLMMTHDTRSTTWLLTHAYHSVRCSSR